MLEILLQLLLTQLVINISFSPNYLHTDSFISFGPQTRRAKFMFPSSIPLQCLTSDISWKIKLISERFSTETRKCKPSQYSENGFGRFLGERRETSFISRLLFTFTLFTNKSLHEICFPLILKVDILHLDHINKKDVRGCFLKIIFLFVTFFYQQEGNLVPAKELDEGSELVDEMMIISRDVVEIITTWPPSKLGGELYPFPKRIIICFYCIRRKGLFS